MIQQLLGLKALKMWRNHDWMLGPDKRRTILSSLCLAWGLAWTISAVLLQIGYDFHYLLPYFNGIIFTVFFIASYLILGRSRTSFVVTITLSIIYWFWIVLISLPLFFTDPRPDIGVAFLVPRSTGTVSILVYVLWGWFWIAFSWLVMIFMPIWNIQIGHGQVFLVGKGYVSRPGVQIDAVVLNQLINTGMNRKLIERYIHFDGPRYMHQQLWTSVGNTDDVATQTAINEFIRQVADPARRVVPPVLWFSAVDNVGVFWDKTQSLAFNKPPTGAIPTPVMPSFPPDSPTPVMTTTSQPLEPQPGEAVVIDQLVTRDGHPIEIELKFSCSFDPEANSVPEFRRALNSAFSKGGNIRAILDSVVRARSIGVARTYFVELPLQAALTEGTIQRFRTEFPAFMQPLEILGITLDPNSVQCRPVIPKQVQAAEIEMLAARATAIKDTARVQELVEKVMVHGVPPDLLGGLIFLDQSTRAENKAFQMNAMSDPMLMPQAGPDQAAPQLYHKFQGDLPNESAPRLPGAQQAPALSSSPDEEIIELPAKEDLPKPQKPPAQPRLTSNLGDKNRKKGD